MHSPERNPRVARLLPWGACLLGLLLVFRPALTSGFRDLQIFFGDPRLVHYVLEHTWLWASGATHHAGFWDPPIFFPALGTGGYTDTMLGVGPLYWLWRALGLDAPVSFQVWMMSCLALNFGAFYLWLRRGLQLGRGAATVGAALFGFASLRAANLNSPQLFPVFYGTFALLSLQRAFDPGRTAGTRRWALAVSFALLVLQAWSTFYPTFFLALALGLAFLTGLLMRATRARIVELVRLAPWTLALGLVCSLAAVWPLAQGHLDAASEVGVREWQPVYKHLPQAGSWIFMGRTNLLYGWLFDVLEFDSPSSQHANGVGLVTLVLVVGGLLSARRRTAVVLTLGASAGLMVLLLRGPGELSPWRLVYELVPGGQALRYPARIGLLLLIPAGLGLALFVERWRLRGGSRVALGVLLALVLVEQAHRLDAYPEDDYRRAIDAVEAQIDPEADAFLLIRQGVGGPERKHRLHHLLAMWAGLQAGVPSVNGFYGNEPPEWKTVQRGADGLAAWLARHDAAGLHVPILELDRGWHPAHVPELTVRQRP